MLLLLNWSNLNEHKEHELNTKSPFGVNVTVIFAGGNVRTIQNCTEVHYLFPNKWGEKACAFESDIHSTGRTVQLHDVLVISITTADEIHDSF